MRTGYGHYVVQEAQAEAEYEAFTEWAERQDELPDDDWDAWAMWCRHLADLKDQRD